MKEESLGISLPAVLHDTLVGLRAVEPTDVDLLLAWENDDSNWRVTDAIAPLSRAVLWQYLQEYVADIYRQGELRFVIVDLTGGEPVGAIELRNFDALSRRAEVGVFIDARYRGDGYAHHALDVLCDYAGRHLGMHQLYAIVSTDNNASAALMAHCGFTSSATLLHWVRRGDEYLDATLWQRIIS